MAMSGLLSESGVNDGWIAKLPSGYSFLADFVRGEQHLKAHEDEQALAAFKQALAAIEDDTLAWWRNMLESRIQSLSTSA